MRVVPILIYIVCVLVLSGCIPPPIEEIDRITPETPSITNIYDHAAISERMTSARFLQLTVRSKDWNKTFSSELYQRNDSTMFFSGGFLGKGAFKGLVSGDSLTLLFLSKKQFFEGNVSGLIEPDLSEYRYVMDRTLNILSGKLLCDSTGLSRWRQRVFVGIDEIRYVIFESRTHPISILADLGSHSDDFPYYEIDRIEIENSKTNARIRANVVEELIREGMDLGEKFTFPDYSNWQPVRHVALTD